jgi:hypothetical protein
MEAARRRSRRFGAGSERAAVQRRVGIPRRLQLGGASVRLCVHVTAAGLGICASWPVNFHVFGPMHVHECTSHEDTILTCKFQHHHNLFGQALGEDAAVCRLACACLNPCQTTFAGERT